MTPTSPAFHDSQLRRAIAPRPFDCSGTTSIVSSAHDCASGAPVSSIPATFVGMPAVIAWTTSCWVVCLRS